MKLLAVLLLLLAVFAIASAERSRRGTFDLIICFGKLRYQRVASQFAGPHLLMSVGSVDAVGVVDMVDMEVIHIMVDMAAVGVA
ncbi:hypothetical protein Aduo_016889 [Ancylostoma duodenale]